MKVYIAGPMTGHPQFNFPAFDLTAVFLRQSGREVVSPAELDDPEDRAAALASPDGHMHGGHHMNKTWGDFLARDVKLIADGGIQAIVVLPGWETSRGARLETFVGFLCGIRTFYFNVETFEMHQVSLIRMARGWLNKTDISFHSEVAA